MTTRAFAYYRLPLQHDIHLVRQCGESAPVSGGFSALDGVRGFVIAPFCLSDDCPMCWIQPDEERLCDTPDEPMMRAWCDEACAEMDVVGDCVLSDDVRMEYSRSFNSFHQAVCQGRFEKLVLARQDVQRDHGAHPVTLFLRACECYPRMFISLFYTPQCGLWLTATPEILLEREAEAWHTVALAGTMRNHDNDTPVWSMKNRGEQSVVGWFCRQHQPDRASDDTCCPSIASAHRFPFHPARRCVGRFIGRDLASHAGCLRFAQGGCACFHSRSGALSAPLL